MIDQSLETYQSWERRMADFQILPLHMIGVVAESEKQAKQWPMAKQQSNTQRKTQGIHKSEQVYIQPWDWHMNALQQDWSAAAGGHLIMNATSSHL